MQESYSVYIENPVTKLYIFRRDICVTYIIAGPLWSVSISAATSRIGVFAVLLLAEEKEEEF
jgi:hypothetical protein